MRLNQLICRAASAFPDLQVLQYWDMEKAQPKKNPTGGDLLAQFIAYEIAETYVPDASDGEQIATAVLAMQQAADSLADVAQALSGLSAERLAA